MAEERCRLIIDTPRSGALNMALDEILLDAASVGGAATVRFYGWTPATLSLGYFQAHSERDSHSESHPIPLVRRATGGGAIVHDRELTYSIAIPRGHRLAARPRELYDAAHGSLVECLGEMGIEARLCEAASPASEGQEPFLCFQRRAVGDVLCGEHKVGGSAQRRWGDAVLQHGSILVERSPFATVLPGLADLASENIKVADLRDEWTSKLIAALGFVADEAMWSADELQRGQQRVETRYALKAWNLRK